MTESRVCSHCQRGIRGLASLNDQPLCHPDLGLDCYRLVTVYGHAQPCPDCTDVRDTETTYDKGGMLPSRAEVRNTGKPEKVATPSQWDQIRDWLNP